MCKSKQTVFIQLGDDSEKLNKNMFSDKEPGMLIASGLFLLLF